VRSSNKDFGVIPSCLYQYCSCQDKRVLILRKDLILLRLEKSLSSYQRNKTHAEIDKMRRISNAYAMESLIDAMLSKRLDICFT